jgi:hypothetical protein
VFWKIGVAKHYYCIWGMHFHFLRNILPDEDLGDESIWIFVADLFKRNEVVVAYY